jgi:hypothetical protein
VIGGDTPSSSQPMRSFWCALQCPPVLLPMRSNTSPYSDGVQPVAASVLVPIERVRVIEAEVVPPSSWPTTLSDRPNGADPRVRRFPPTVPSPHHEHVEAGKM